MLLNILLAINILVCIALIAVVLLQRSEGGALGMGGGPTGFMSARGAGDLLTRTTWILFSVFLGLSVLLVILGGRMQAGGSVTDRLKIDRMDPSQLNQPAAPTPTAPAPGTTPASPAPASPFQAPTPQLGAPAAPAPTPAN